MPRRLLLIGLPLLAIVAVVAALLLRSRPGPVVQSPTPVNIATAVPTDTPGPQPRPRPGYTPVPAGTISPVVVWRSPARGEALDPTGAIELVFDRPMDQAAVASAFTLIPRVKGTIAWTNERTMKFLPSQPLARETIYDVVLDQAARATDGAPLNEAYRFRFTTSGFLEAAQVIPAPGATDVQAATTITVIFNRPVVALVNSPDLASLPRPLRLEPAVAGQGEWLNTSVYVFRPDQPLASGITYTATVDGSLTDTDGNLMAADFRWQFSVAPPQVVDVFPADGDNHISVEPALRVRFNQDVDPAAARAAFSLSGPEGTVPGESAVTGSTLTFTPSSRLRFAAPYTARVAAGVTGTAGGAGMAAEYAWRFTTVPLPRLLATEPRDGAQDASPYTQFALQFNTIMDPASLWRNLQITPAISPTQVYTYFNDYNYTFIVGLGAKPSTDYEVRIGPGMADPYGNTTGDTRVVRFRTGPLPPSVQLIAPDNVATYSSLDPARVVLHSVNASQAALTLYRLAPRDLVGWHDWRSQPPPAAARLRQWRAQLAAPLNETVNTRIDLREDGGPLDPGVYLLVLDDPEDQWDRYQMMVVSPYNLTLKVGATQALAWANRLSDGAPVAGVALTFYTDDGSVLGSATTDQSGVARLEIDNLQRRQVVALGACDQAPCPDFSAAAEGWSSGISPWEFGLQGGGYSLLNAYVYTDRPIYRPGQQVDFKGIVRAERDARYSLPQNLRSVAVRVSSPAGEQIYNQTLQLSQLGAFADTLKLAESAALGQYFISVQAGDASFGFPFTVAAYRPPEFEVGVRVPAAEIVRGTPIAASVDVSYFFGGPVAGAPVQWNVLAQPYTFDPPALGRYSFRGGNDPWVCFDCWWQPPVPPTPIASGSGATDANGRLEIRDLRLDEALRQSPVANLPITQSLRLIIEATATGRDNQVISGRGELVVHQGEFYIGLAPRSYLGAAGQEQQVDVVTADWAGKRLPGQTVELEIVRLEWENRLIQDGAGERWEFTETRTSVGRQALTTDGNGEAVLRFTPDKGGSYHIIARGRDGGGRTVEASLFLWVSGSDYIPWRRDNNDRISLISDRTSYRPGETADILIPSPFQGPTWALVTVERGEIRRHEVFQLQSNSAVYRLPLRDDDAPNVFVSVVLFTGPEAPGRPADYKVGYLPLLVEPAAQTLTVTLTPDRETAAPGETVTYQVQATDAGGGGVAVDLSLDLVDKAVLSLQPRQVNAIKGAFYSPRGLGISTSSGLSVSANRLLEQLEQRLKDAQQPGVSGQDFGAINNGLSGDTAAPAAAPAPTAGVATAERAADQAAAPPGVTLRSEFADTAFWQASFATDAAGRGTVQIKLPDNLTTWVLRGVGITGATQVGEGTVEVVATRPLLIRPVTPRFFVVGDSARLAANVSNTTSQALNVEVALAATGVRVTSPLSVTVQIPAKSETQVNWTVEVSDAPDSQSLLFADLVFSAVSGEFSDAAKPRLASGPDGTLPIYRYSVPEVVGTGGLLDAAGARTEIVALPPGVDASRGELTVRLDPSLAAGMRDGLNYLEHFEWECTEQTVSRFLPNVLTLTALKKLGIANPELEARLPDLVKEGVMKLALRQHGDGGWGWWSDDKSNPHISAYVVLGLSKARAAGFAVSDDVLNRGIAYLQGQLKAADVQMAPFEANTQALMLYTLAEAGQPNRDMAQSLLKLREKLSVYARALLAMALHTSDAADPGIKTMLADLNNSAIMSATGAHWEENDRDWWSMNTDTRTTAMVLQALVRLDRQSPIAANAVRWLMVARQDGIWETTQETAWALMALTEWMAATGELQGNYDYATWLNEVEQAGGRVEPATVDQPIVTRIAVAGLLQDAGNKLTVGRGEGPGVLYYTAHLRSYLPVEQVKALDRGIIVRRRYTLASCTEGLACPEVTQVKVGDVIRVDLTIIAPHDLYYLRVEDPLPAGAEAVDTGLATTSLLAQDPTLRSSGPLGDGGPWGWWWRWYSRSELRDEKVALFADFLSRGSYEYSYTMRATLPGSFHVIPTTAGEFYFPEVYGRGDGSLLTITP